MTQRTFGNLGKYGITEIKSFTLRRLKGDDEIAAYDRTGSGSGAGAIARIREELMAEAIVEIDGTPVPSPHIEWKGYERQTRSVMRMAFDQFVDLTDEAAELFLAQEFPELESKQPTTDEPT